MLPPAESPAARFGRNPRPEPCLGLLRNLSHPEHHAATDPQRRADRANQLRHQQGHRSKPRRQRSSDVLGNSSLLNNTGAPVLTKIPLTWSSSEPMAVSAASCTDLNCSISTPGAGAGSVTASCTPPTCNIGFPQVPPGLLVPGMRDFSGHTKLPAFHSSPGLRRNASPSTPGAANHRGGGGNFGRSYRCAHSD